MAGAGDHDDDPRTRAAAAEALYEQALRADLERRITELAHTPDAAFGRMGVGDGILVGLLFVVAPALVAWVFR